MAEAGGDLWDPLSQVCSGAQGGAFPPPPALRILNSPSMATAARAALDPQAGVSRAPLLAPLSLEEEFITNPLQEPPGLLLTCSVIPPTGIRVVQVSHEEQGLKICKYQPEAAPVSGGSDPLYFPTKTSPFPVLPSLLSSLLAPHPSPSIPAALPRQGQLPFLVLLSLLKSPQSPAPKIPEY